MVSVPKKIKCRSTGDTSICLEAVGAPETTVALTAVALATVESHEKHLPL